jgi:hypothetical protein
MPPIPIPIIGAILANLLLFLVLFLVLMLVLGTLFLMAGLSAVNGKHRVFGTTLGTVVIGSLLMLVLPCLGCILYWYFINVRHDTGWGGAIGAWVIAGLIPLVIVFGLLIVVFGIALF